MAMAEDFDAVDPPLRVLIVRGSFAALGGGERELLQLIRHASKRWKISLATLQFPDAAKELLADSEVQIIQPKKPFSWPVGAVGEVFAAHSYSATKQWKKMKIDWSQFDVVHLSVCRGTMEIVNSCSKDDLAGKGLHYHCLEPPRWLYEDVLHRNLDGRLKRPLWITKLIFANQRRIDQKIVRRFRAMKGTAISGNSMSIQKRVADIYDIASDKNKANGGPPRRNSKGQMLEATHLMHVLDWDLWPCLADADEEDAANEVQQAFLAAQKSQKIQKNQKNQNTQQTPQKYVTSIGKISYVKGTWQTLESLQGTGLSLVQIGGGEKSDKQKIIAYAKQLGVEIYCMPRLSQPALRALIRDSIAMVSHAHNEPFGLSPLEAMAIGVPALMVDEGGFHNTMSPVDSGMLIERFDYAAWNEAYRLAQDDETRKLWALNGRKYVEENFTLNVQIEALENLLLECLKGAA